MSGKTIQFLFIKLMNFNFFPLVYLALTCYDTEEGEGEGQEEVLCNVVFVREIFLLFGFTLRKKSKLNCFKTLIKRAFLFSLLECCYLEIQEATLRTETTTSAQAI